MSLTDYLANKTVNRNRYRTNSKAIILSCFFNPQNSPYRLFAFQKYYKAIKHLNHQIIECIIGDAKPQLPESPNITRIHTKSLLWHKEALLNKLIKELPPKYKYVFWIDADVLFTNKNWLVDSCKQLERSCILQPFEYCIHLKRDQLTPNFDPDVFKPNINNRRLLKSAADFSPVGVAAKYQMWRSFCANVATTYKQASNENYDVHGHVGFAWGARRELFEHPSISNMPLYDKCLIGGADHIIAHAAAGHIPHSCITKGFKDDIENVEKWMRDFNNAVYFQRMDTTVSFAPGDLYHIWHGDVSKREYLKRVQTFTPKTREITEKDKNGLYETEDDSYVRKYFDKREVISAPITSIRSEGWRDKSVASPVDDFFATMGYYLEDFCTESYKKYAKPEHIENREWCEKKLSHDSEEIGAGFPSFSGMTEMTIGEPAVRQMDELLSSPSTTNIVPTEMPKVQAEVDENSDFSAVNDNFS